jgi:hypothetical protein
MAVESDIGATGGSGNGLTIVMFPDVMSPDDISGPTKGSGRLDLSSSGECSGLGGLENFPHGGAEP